MQQAYDTYCAMEPQYAGIYGKAKEPLVPVSHQIVNAELELTLDADGHLLDARSVEAEQAATIIPVTESSSGRVGDTTCAHPLCDQIRFLSPLYPAKYESYLTQLHRWELSPYGHPKLSAIVRYVERGTIVEDLAQRGVISLNEKGLPTKEKQVVRWRVETGVESDTPACWQDQSLFQAFIDYYASTKSEKPVFCIQSPSLSQIADCAFGTVRISDKQTKLETDERVMRQQVQRLLSCRVDRGKMPADIARAAAAKAFNLQIMDAALRETVLFTACAVLRKYKYDWYKEEWGMALEPQKKDVSYQYGRLLAVFEKLERDTYDPNEQREPNAIRMQSVFAKRPLYASRIIWEQLKKAYYPKLKPGARTKYDRIIEQIIQEISSFPQAEQEEALKDTYLFGYYLQRSALYTSGKTENSQEEE